MAKLEITFEDWTRLPIGSVDFAPQRSIYDMTREFVKSIDPEIVVEQIVVNPDNSHYSYFGTSWK